MILDADTMDDDLARKLVSRLNGNAYVDYVHSLFTQWYGERKTPTSYSKFGVQEDYDIDSKIFQIYSEYSEGRTPAWGLFHAYEVFIPHNLPMDLGFNLKKLNIKNPILMKELQKISERYVLWYRDVESKSSAEAYNCGDLLLGVFFLTNFCDVPKESYYKYLLPKYGKLLNKYNLKNILVGIGSPDTFFDKDPNTAKKVFFDFISENIDGLCINLSMKDDFTIDYYTSEKYLKSGVTQRKMFPTETVYINYKRKKERIIKEFEGLIASNPSEKRIERFLKENYKEIFGPNYDRIETQLWLRFPELTGETKGRRLDIFLRNTLIGDWELIELKRPQKITYSRRNIPVLSKEVHNAIQQIRHYEKILMQEKIRKRFESEGIKYFEPELKIVIGRKPQISHQDWRWLKKTNERDIRIITYDDLINEMKIRLKDFNKIKQS